MRFASIIAAALSLLAAVGFPAQGHAAESRVPPAATLGPLPEVVQTLNNCGPASISEVLSYWGVSRSQEQVAVSVRADNVPWGMAPFGIPSYARSLHMRAMIGVDGTEPVVKALVAHGFPVIVNQWVSDVDHVRHFRPIEAYDNRRRVFVSADPYLGAGHLIDYASFDRIWTVSDRRFIVLYSPSRMHALASVLAAAHWSRTAAYRHDLAWQTNRLLHMPVQVPMAVQRYYGYPSIAWDDVSLRNWAAARHALSEAVRQGTSSIMVNWIRSEMQWRTSRWGRQDL